MNEPGFLTEARLFALTVSWFDGRRDAPHPRHRGVLCEAVSAEEVLGVEGGECRAWIVEETRLGSGSASGHDLVVHCLTLTGPAPADG